MPASFIILLVALGGAFLESSTEAIPGNLTREMPGDKRVSPTDDSLPPALLAGERLLSSFSGRTGVTPFPVTMGEVLLACRASGGVGGEVLQSGPLARPTGEILLLFLSRWRLGEGVLGSPTLVLTLAVVPKMLLDCPTGGGIVVFLLIWVGGEPGDTLLVLTPEESLTSPTGD